MATVSVERRSGKVTGYNIQWLEGEKRCGIHLGGKQYAKETAERLKVIVEKLLFYRLNGIAVPASALEHWQLVVSAEINAKLERAKLIMPKDTQMKIKQ